MAAGAGRAAGVDDSVVFVERGGEMNAQNAWKVAYRTWLEEDYYEWRCDMRDIRREAALERKLEAAQRATAAAVLAEREACAMAADRWDVPCDPRTEAEAVAHYIAAAIRARNEPTKNESKGKGA
jgi:hypothetical protein